MKPPNALPTNSKPRLLDLFCCEGGAATGYYRAGFDVVGVDVKPQPRYPFEFHRADAMTYPLEGFDAIHASPPCQAYSVAKVTSSKVHPMLVPAVRERLQSSGLPYVIENVIGAPLHAPIVLCGTMFDLKTTDADGSPIFLRRHRLFESNVWLTIPMACRCQDLKDRGLRVAGVYGGGRAERSNGRRGGYTPLKAQRTELIGAEWMSMHGLSQAIPPAYTEWIGEQLLRALECAA